MEKGGACSVPYPSSPCGVCSKRTLVVPASKTRLHSQGKPALTSTLHKSERITHIPPGIWCAGGAFAFSRRSKPRCLCGPWTHSRSYRLSNIRLPVMVHAHNRTHGISAGAAKARALASSRGSTTLIKRSLTWSASRKPGMHVALSRHRLDATPPRGIWLFDTTCAFNISTHPAFLWGG